jgi:EmrB/QacA subfamily drug resistance transporter
MTAVPPAAALPDLTRQQKALTLAGVLMGMLLAALDQTIVSTAGPAIQRDLGMPASLYAWITTAYLVSSTVLVPIYGKLSDLYGRKPILLAGILLFLTGSVLCGLSRTTMGLILGRAVQGVGSASLFTSAFAVVADLFPPAIRGRYTGLFGGVWGFASVVGPLAGGFLTDHLGWHWVFFVNLPVGLVAAGFIAAKMPPLGRRAQRPRIDVAGALALTATVVPFLVALSLGRAGPGVSGSPAAVAAGGYHWSSPLVLALFGLSLVSGAAFVAIERRAPEPILDFSLFRIPIFAWGNAAVFVIGAAFFAGIVFLPLFMVNVVGLSATRSGATLTPLTLALVFGNVVSGQLVTRLGRYRPLMLCALVVLVAAFAVLGFTLSPASTQTGVTLKMILVGLGLGPSIPLYTLAIQNGVSPDRIGVATSTATFFRQMGATIGVALQGTVFAAAMARGAAERAAGGLEPVELKEVFAAAISDVYRVATLIAIVAFLVTARLPELPLRKSNR